MDTYKSVPWCDGMARTVRIPDPNPPPPPPDPPKVFEPIFLQFEILGERVGAKGTENFLPFLRGYFCFTPYVSLLKILRILWRIQKCLKNTENLDGGLS